ncbi:hypothetical protein [Parasitella parasitica]|uniref:CHRD domain-containing protein n=1 Tax=Parasitella parasitica TaxID=35722 RepID=A0A0B7NIS3_9FUNG|nr:hypothetical protein [Parasitella parasitica]
MKFSGIITTAASMFVAGAFAQSTFNVSSLNGTWAVGGLESTLLVKIEALAQIYNMTVSCPQVYMAATSNNSVYIQPSVEFGWYNSTSQSSQNANISLSGLMTTDDNGANFDVQFSLPSVAKGLVANQVHMLDAALSGGNTTNPLPHGADYQANLFVKLVSSKNDGVNDVVVASCSNVTDIAPSDEGVSNFVRRDEASSQVPFQLLLVNGNITLDEAGFENITSSLGDETSLSMLNNTCSA